MTTTIRLTYDGEVFRPHGPVPLPANTEVDATIEPVEPEAAVEEEPGEERPFAFLDEIASLNLEGPPDWSKRIHEYGSGEADRHFRQAGFQPLLETD